MISKKVLIVDLKEKLRILIWFLMIIILVIPIIPPKTNIKNSSPKSQQTLIDPDQIIISQQIQNERLAVCIGQTEQHGIESELWVGIFSIDSNHYQWKLYFEYGGTPLDIQIENSQIYLLVTFYNSTRLQNICEIYVINFDNPKIEAKFSISFEISSQIFGSIAINPKNEIGISLSYFATNYYNNLTILQYDGLGTFTQTYSIANRQFSQNLTSIIFPELEFKSTEIQLFQTIYDAKNNQWIISGKQRYKTENVSRDILGFWSYIPLLDEIVFSPTFPDGINSIDDYFESEFDGGIIRRIQYLFTTNTFISYISFYESQSYSYYHQFTTIQPDSNAQFQAIKTIHRNVTLVKLNLQILTHSKEKMYENAFETLILLEKSPNNVIITELSPNLIESNHINLSEYLEISDISEINSIASEDLINIFYFSESENATYYYQIPHQFFNPFEIGRDTIMLDWAIPFIISLPLIIFRKSDVPKKEKEKRMAKMMNRTLTQKKLKTLEKRK